MCGICGFTGQVTECEQVIREMGTRITHRGPDSEGYYIENGISMGFRRLSIIDLEGGNQPIYNEDKTLVLTLNGEIYNYKQLREQLIKQNHVFKTETDSEVLVRVWWGEQLLPHEGMFALPFGTRWTKPFLLRAITLE